MEGWSHSKQIAVFFIVLDNKNRILGEWGKHTQ